MLSECQCTLYYLNNVLSRPISVTVQRAICDWADEYAGECFQVDFEAFCENVGNEKSSAGQQGDAPQALQYAEKWKILKKLSSGRTLKKPKRTSRLYRHAERIADGFSLEGADREILLLLFNASHYISLEKLIQGMEIDLCWLQRKYFSALGNILNLRVRDIECCFMQSSALMSNGLFRSNNGNLSPSESLLKIINTPYGSGRNIKSIILGEKIKPVLTGECFVHLADEYAHLVSLLRAAVKRRERGVNILLYGPPGTGKTELAKTLCAEIQADLYSLSENLQNDYCEGGGRLSELYAAQAVLRTEDQTVLLADEAEDIFRGKYSKLSMNRLLEKNVTPVIWISNNIEFMDPAYIRRFSYAVFINTPPLSARVRIWKNELHKKNISIPAAEVEHLARRYDLPPSFTSEAIRIAGMLRDKSSIDRTLQSLECALGGKPKAPCGERPDVFHPALLNTDTDLEKLAERVERGNNLSFSLCLFGAPGTGKSAYARYLAGRMGFETLHKRASDLQSMWLGETEKNIARAFLEAREGKKLLIFDEVDSFLQDRGRAVRSWEVSQVNEMLAWMENHPYPFVCTTNLLESLDKASLRRFTFKVKYEYLTPNQASLAFRHFFGLEYSLDMRALTPGDFAVVKKKAAILGMREPAELAGLLAQEQEARGVVKSAKIGF